MLGLYQTMLAGGAKPATAAAAPAKTRWQPGERERMGGLMARNGSTPAGVSWLLGGDP